MKKNAPNTSRDIGKACPARKIQVAVVDDHTMMRNGLRQAINEEPGMEVCWTADSVAVAMRELERMRPDMLTVDITLPGRNGLELIKDVLAFASGLPILVISMHEETLYAERVLKAGAKGYIMKNAQHANLMEAIRRVADGKIWLSPVMSEEIISSFSGGRQRRAADGIHRLSDREFEVFQLLGDCKSTHQIAESLHISTKTVDVHKTHIREKLELADSADTLRHAIRWAESKRMSGE